MSDNDEVADMLDDLLDAAATFAKANQAAVDVPNPITRQHVDSSRVKLMTLKRRFLARLSASPATSAPDAGSERIGGIRFTVDHTIPPGEVHFRQDGRVVARLINVDDGEVATGSPIRRATPSSASSPAPQDGTTP